MLVLGCIDADVYKVYLRSAASYLFLHIGIEESNHSIVSDGGIRLPVQPAAQRAPDTNFQELRRDPQRGTPGGKQRLALAALAEHCKAKAAPRKELCTRSKFECFVLGGISNKIPITIVYQSRRDEICLFAHSRV